jgi:hypothetical protein
VRRPTLLSEQAQVRWNNRRRCHSPPPLALVPLGTVLRVAAEPPTDWTAAASEGTERPRGAPVTFRRSREPAVRAVGIAVERMTDGFAPAFSLLRPFAMAPTMFNAMPNVELTG